MNASTRSFFRLSLALVWLTTGLLAQEEPATWEEWLAVTDQRIQDLRTGPLEVTVTDSTGEPLSNRDVELRMTRHAFNFGMDAVVPDPREPDAAKDWEKITSLRPTFLAVGSFASDYWYGDHGPGRDALALRKLQAVADRGYPALGQSILYRGDEQMERDSEGNLLPNDQLVPIIRNQVTERLERVYGTADPFFAWIAVNEMNGGNDYHSQFATPEYAEIMLHARAELDRLGGEDDLLAVNEGLTPSKVALLWSINQDIEWNQYREKVRALLDAGVPIDLLGMQSHVAGPSDPLRPPREARWFNIIYDFLTHVSSSLDDMPIWITELDINLDITDGDGVITPEEMQADADFIEALMRLYFSHPAMAGITWWGGLVDREHWKRNSPFYFDDGTPKPMLQQGWIDLVLGEWWTQVGTTTDATGKATANGFYGDYEVVVHRDNNEQVETAAIAFAHTAEQVPAAVRVTFPQDVMADIEYLGQQRYTLPGLGAFTTRYFPWVYHEDLADYIFLHDVAGDSLWFYSDRYEAWFFTLTTAFPWLWTEEYGWMFVFTNPAYPFYAYIAVDDAIIDLSQQGDEVIPEGDERLANGGFATDLDGWELETGEGTEATLSRQPDNLDGATDEAGHALVTTSAEGDHTAAATLATTVEIDHDFDLYVRFVARADTPRPLTLALVPDGDYGVTYWEGTVNLTTIAQSYAFRFPNLAWDPAAQLVFRIKGADATVAIDDVMVRHLDFREPASPFRHHAITRELLANADFAAGLESWSADPVSGAEEVATVPGLEGPGVALSAGTTLTQEIANAYPDAPYTISFDAVTGDGVEEATVEVAVLAAGETVAAWSSPLPSGAPLSWSKAFTTSATTPWTVQVTATSGAIVVGAISLQGASSTLIPEEEGTPIEGLPDWMLIDFASKDAQVTYDPGADELTLQARQGDAWLPNPSDGHAWVTRPVSGDWQVTVDIMEVASQGVWNKAGLLMRPSRVGNSRHAHLLMTAAKGIHFQYRHLPGTISRPVAPSAPLESPARLRLERRGPIISGYYAEPDGPWMLLRRIILPGLPEEVWVGPSLAPLGEPTTARFQNLTVEMLPSTAP